MFSPKQITVFSMDISAASIETARRACSGATQLILNDSVAALNALAAIMPKPASLLYLDSFDLDPTNPTPSAIHHAMEVMAARKMLGPGTIVAIDDYGSGTKGGKGMIIDTFFESIGVEVLHEGYQKVWRMPRGRQS
jgi:hypothetical protein